MLKYDIPYQCDTVVIPITSNKTVTAVSHGAGLEQIQAKSIILAMGCRECPRDSHGIPGWRCAGVAHHCRIGLDGVPVFTKKSRTLTPGEMVSFQLQRGFDGHFTCEMHDKGICQQSTARARTRLRNSFSRLKNKNRTLRTGCVSPPFTYSDKKGGCALLPLLQSFFSLPPELMTALGTVIGFAALGDLTADQQDSLGNFLILAGQILETSSSQKQLLEDQASARTIAAMQRELAVLRQAVYTMQKNIPPPV